MWVTAYDEGGAAVAALGAIAIYLLLLLAIALGCGFGARSLMRNKGRSPAAGFCLGFFLGLVGLIIAAVLPETPEAEATRLRRQMEVMGIAPSAVAAHGAGTFNPIGSLAGAPAAGAVSPPVAAASTASVVAIVSLVLNVVYLLLSVAVARFSDAFGGWHSATGGVVMVAAIAVSVVAVVRKSPIWIGAAAGTALRVVGAMSEAAPALVMAVFGFVALGVVIRQLMDSTPELELGEQLRIGLFVAGGVSAVIALWGARPYEPTAWLSMLAVYGGGFGTAAVAVARPSRGSIGAALGWSAASLAAAIAMLGRNSYSQGPAFATQITVLLFAALLVAAVVVLRKLTDTGPASSGALNVPPESGDAAVGGEVAAPPPPRAAEWGTDPFGRHSYRYFDGRQWTDQVSDQGVVSTDPPVAVAPLPRPTVAVSPPPPVVVPPSLVPPVQTGVPAPVAPVPNLPSDDEVDATVRRSPSSQTARLVFSNGMAHRLVGTVIVGRKPVPLPGDPHAVPIELNDPSSSISRSHCVVGLDAAGVWVEDLGSANGTVVTALGREEVLGAGQRRFLEAGAQVKVGDLCFWLEP